jgi:two-component system phosphate regulon response regulator OmpR
MNGIKILSLEDDQNLATVMRHYLVDEGMDLSQVATGADCLNAVNVNQFDIILMDLGLPDVDGLTLIPQIRTQFQGPIIVISGKSSTTDRIVGLEMGADDYMTKPFEMRELLARIKANTRRVPAPVQPTDNNKDDIFQFHGFEYDNAKLSLTYNSEIIELTSGECELLELFLNSKGRALSREYLFEQTREGNFDSYDRAVDIAVTRLRKKLNDDPSNPEIIKTIRGTGYMFIADVITQ